MNAITTQEVGFSLSPRSLNEAMEFSKIIAQSDLVPKDYAGKPGNVLVAVQAGAEIGLKPMQALQGIAVVNGRPTLWGDALWALVLSHPEFEDTKDEITDAHAKVVLKRRGMSAITRIFTQDDARKAGLWGKSGPWTTNPKRMMLMRARTFAARDLFADALKGFTSTEEARDLPVAEIDMGNAETVESPLVPVAREHASKGWEAYRQHWQSLTAEQRREIGAQKHEELKAVAAQADAEIAQPAPATQAAEAVDDEFVRDMDAAERE